MKTKLLFTFFTFISFFSPSLAQVQIGQSIDVSADGGRVFGISMNDDGNRLVFGNPLYNGVQGNVKAYEYNGSSWNQLGNELLGETDNDFMGFNLEMNGQGNRMVVGSFSGNGGDGKAEVFEFNGTEWEQLGGDLESDIQGDGGAFGHNVSMSKDGSRIAVGEPFYDQQNGAFGRVVLFEFNGSDWEQMGAPITGLYEFCELGWGVALDNDGSHVVVGAPGYVVSDSAYMGVYQFNGSDWILDGNIISGEDLDEFGKEVEINEDGTIIATNGPYDDTNGENAGVTKIYKFNGTNWQSLGDIYGPESNFGLWRLDMNASGNLLYIPSSSSGSSIYQFDGTQWFEIASFEDGDFGAFNGTGSRIAFSSVLDEVKVFDLTGILEITELENKLEVILAPNPVQNVLKLNRTFDNLRVQVFDIAGKLLNEQQVVDQIDMHQYPAGSYLLNLYDGNKAANFKVVKE